MKKLILLFSLFFFLMTSAQEKKEINTDTKTENIEKQISDLQKQIKVLEKQLDKNKEVENTYKNDIEVIEKVEGFYDRSWSKLIFLITVLGVVVPSIITWWQNRNFNNEQEKFKNQLAETEKNFRKELKDHYMVFQEQLKIKITETEQNLITSFNREYDKLKQEVSYNVMKMNEDIYNEISHARFFNFLMQAERNFKKKAFIKTINCYGAALKYLLKTIPDESLTENALFIIKELEYLIRMVSKENIDLSSYKEQKENTLKSLNHILTSNILPGENERIQKIINFIENH